MLNYLKIYNLGWRKEESQGKRAAWGQPEFVQIISLPNTMDAHHASLGRRTVRFSSHRFLHFWISIIPSSSVWLFLQISVGRDSSKESSWEIDQNFFWTRSHPTFPSQWFTPSLSLSHNQINFFKILNIYIFFFCAQIFLEWKNQRAEIGSQR